MSIGPYMYKHPNGFATGNSYLYAYQFVVGADGASASWPPPLGGQFHTVFGNFTPMSQKPDSVSVSGVTNSDGTASAHIVLDWSAGDTMRSSPMYEKYCESVVIASKLTVDLTVDGDDKVVGSAVYENHFVESLPHAPTPACANDTTCSSYCSLCAALSIANDAIETDTFIVKQDLRLPVSAQ
jgi:hypothetical protein